MQLCKECGNELTFVTDLTNPQTTKNTQYYKCPNCGNTWCLDVDNINPFKNNKDLYKLGDT